jgi:hypothetical protein
MSSVLAITASTSLVPLDEQRKGETSFTVYNASGRAMRVRVMVTPTAPAAASWLAIDGESEREFPVSGAQQFTVKVAVPADVTTGRYSFRLDALDMANPDDPAVQGPAVAFEVTTAPIPVPAQKKGYLAALVGGAVGELAGLALGFLLGALVSGLLAGTGGNAGSIAWAVLQWVVALLGAVLGAGLALRSGNYNYYAETALILAGVVLVWVGLLVGVLLVIGSPRILSEGGGPAVLLLCVSGPLALVVPPFAARAITLLWKTGKV